MSGQNALSFKGMGMLLRVIAVVGSSVATVISTWLPLLLFYEFSAAALLMLLMLLIIGAFLIHGLLTHVFNDITDFESGTDQFSPALLSGGSRVIQTGVMSLQMLKKMGLTAALLLALIAAVLAGAGQFELAILIIVGTWGAATYSLKPFRFAYHPFLGEWLSLFPSMLFLGLAAPWLMLETIPVWGWQNALVNALWCMAWVMVHHIPDLEADRRAVPLKRTSVVWSVGRFGIRGARYPAVLYLGVIGLMSLWILASRPVAAIGVVAILVYSVFLIGKMNPEDAEEVTDIEKKLLLAAMATAVWMGIFI
ncbi:prenyltransferase [Salinicoccus halodurans]|uniref:1,4-dihydroxy-2-naphthoate octaprenyltransferase n=1 Tax=Salinicoccus halodurans TaxID=407035 RepID=A0A0F7HIA7_9STAP|nr:prenyltransferase [Salinicoccus halodurans]AKG73277.1 1,4-dihydroxy-2-naphthoate prenyltransferase [Salinicoccus halodurans]SFK82986.1 1,4-dihydroxy-2-naphthoate octaprenyltransferase [Salinicoccus halodurans]